MGEIVELFKEIDINNIGYLIAISIVLIIIVASCIQPFYASKVETILMSKSDELKKISFMYVILFFVLGVMNYVFTSNASFVLLGSIYAILMLIIYFVLYILNRKGKAKTLYLWYKDNMGLAIIVTIFPIAILAISVMFDINIVSCVILGALVEIIVVALIYLNMGQINSSIVLKIGSEKWYVFRRIDDAYLLCGDKNNINISTRIKLVEMDCIIQEKLCFEKDTIENE